MVASIASKFRRKNTPKGQIIHSVRDGFGLIEVVDTQVARSLYFGTRVEQSRLYFNAPMTLAFEYQEALMESILEHPAAINRLLTLGLGGGSLPAQMHHIFRNADKPWWNCARRSSTSLIGISICRKRHTSTREKPTPTCSSCRKPNATISSSSTFTTR